MIANIEKLSENQSELPLILKLGAYRRNLMLSGLDRNKSETKERGQSILNAMMLFKSEIEPELYSTRDYDKFVDDPLGNNKVLEPEEVEEERRNNYAKTVAFKKVKELGPGVLVDTAEYEKVLRGEDEES